MRVLHVIPSVARKSGGPAELIRELLPALVDNGVKIRLVSTTKDMGPDDADIWSFGEVHLAPCWSPRWTVAPALVSRLWKEVGNTDIVHVHSVHTFPSTVAMIIARLRKRPVFLQPHGALNAYHLAQRRWLKIAYLRLLDRFGLGAVHTAIYSSSVEVRDGNIALPRIKPSWLPLGVSQDILSAPRREGPDTRVLFLARLAEKKRLDLFLRALADLGPETGAWEARVAGPLDPALSYDPVQLAQTLGIDERVIFLGEVNATQRRKLLSQSAIYVLPSDDESFGMSVAEAMAAGCAVVATPAVGCAVDAGSSAGVRLTQQSVEALSVQIRELLGDVAGRKHSGQLARNYAHSNLAWTAVAERLTGYYEAVPVNRVET
ncbi:glycosyltransferase [Microbacterium sp. LMI1-1-1.1]|uniref:glycosyltransferase n=1 Tax=Microbacterium sp. LMI1-1-1.1 TaxID=3135223 RepID=UPI003465528F